MMRKDFAKGSSELGGCLTRWIVRHWGTRIPSPLSLTSSGYEPAPRILWYHILTFSPWSKSLLRKERFHTPSYILTCQHHGKKCKRVGSNSRKNGILLKPASMPVRRRFWSLPADFTRRRPSTLTSHQRGCAMSFYIKNFVIFCPWGIYVLTNFFLIWRVFSLFATNLNFWILECITWITYHSSYA